MYKLCKTEQSALRQRQLEEGLLHAMKTRRYDEITISDLCDQLQVPRKSFYRYFSGKDGALHALIDHTLLEFQQVMDDNHGSGSISDAQTALVRYFEFWLERRQLLDAMEKSKLYDLLVQRAVIQNLSADTNSVFRLPEALHGVHKQANAFLICGLMSMVFSWHREGCRQTPKEMAAVAVTVMSSPLLDISAAR